MKRTPSRNAFSMSPATTEVTRRSLSSVTLTMKSQPAIRAICGVLLVDRVAIEDSAVGPGMLEQFRPVPALDRLERGHAGADQLPAPGIAGHQVRLDQAGRDLQVGLRRSGCRSSRESRATVVPTNVCSSSRVPEVVFDAVARHDLGPEHLELFRVGAGPVQAGRDQNQGVRSRGMPASRRTSSIGRRIVWLGTGRVMSQIKMQASLRPCGQLAQRGRADRFFERGGDGGLGIVERRNVAESPAGRPRDLREASHGQSRPPVVERECAVDFMVMGFLTKANVPAF